MTEDTTTDTCTRAGCGRRAPPGHRCSDCRGAATAAELGIQQSVDELLAVLDAAEQQATLGRFNDGD